MKQTPLSETPKSHKPFRITNEETSKFNKQQQHKDQRGGSKITTNLGIIVFPDPASNLMAPQIESLKLDLPNAQFLRSGVLGRLVLN